MDKNNLVEQFMDISKEMNRDIAAYYLELSEENVQKAVNLYYEDKLEKSQSSSATVSKSNITILQWNIQGLLETCLLERTVAVMKEIKRLSPDVVMLQEIVWPILNYIKSSCQEYKAFSSFDYVPSSYFTLLMVKSSSFQVTSHNAVRFPTTRQGRSLMSVSGVCCGKKMTVMTSHLESTGPEAPSRMRQLVQVWKTINETDPSHTVVFGGDTNLRDREVAQMKRQNSELARKIDDIWEKLGSSEETRYSWDCTKNDNQLQNAQAKLRMGRLYTRGESPSSSSHFHPTSFQFVGMDRLPCGMFPSDHWGILVEMSAAQCQQ